MFIPMGGILAESRGMFGSLRSVRGVEKALPCARGVWGAWRGHGPLAFDCRDPAGGGRRGVGDAVRASGDAESLDGGVDGRGVFVSVRVPCDARGAAWGVSVAGDGGDFGVFVVGADVVLSAGGADVSDFAVGGFHGTGGVGVSGGGVDAGDVVGESGEGCGDGSVG